MNAIRSFNGVERAAVLMMLVGEEEAAAILQKLDPEEVRSLGKAMFNVADVSEAEVETVGVLSNNPFILIVVVPYVFTVLLSICKLSDALHFVR